MSSVGATGPVGAIGPTGINEKVRFTFSDLEIIEDDRTVAEKEDDLVAEFTEYMSEYMSKEVIEAYSHSEILHSARTWGLLDWDIEKTLDAMYEAKADVDFFDSPYGDEFNEFLPELEDGGTMMREWHFATEPLYAPGMIMGDIMYAMPSIGDSSWR